MAELTFLDMMQKHGIDPATTLVMRHRPEQPSLARVLPWLVDEHPEAFNAYQSTQYPRQQKQFEKAEFLASFLAMNAGEAVFVGFYRMASPELYSRKRAMADRAFMKLVEYGFPTPAVSMKWYPLKLQKSLLHYKGKLIIEWSGGSHGGRSWSRWATSKAAMGFPVKALLPASVFSTVTAMPTWDRLILTWTDLQNIPKAWSDAIKQWKGIYLIQDSKDGKCYVGAAYGKENLWGRWCNCYAKSGHGGNVKLRKRDPCSFVFSILQLVAQDAHQDDVLELEASWKIRLHTRTHGLNSN